MAVGWRRVFCTSTDSSAIDGGGGGGWTPRSGALRRLLTSGPSDEPILSPRLVLAAIRCRLRSTCNRTPPSSRHAPPVFKSPGTVHGGRDSSSVAVVRGGDLKKKLYDDDEPLTFSSTGGAFTPIMERDEMDGHDAAPEKSPEPEAGLEVALLPEVAAVASAKDQQTWAAVLRVKAPAAARDVKLRSPLDIVLVLDAGAEILPLRSTPRCLVSALSSGDRLSIFIFSGGSGSVRLLPLKRMTSSGRRLSNQLLDSISGGGGGGYSDGACVDALHKAVKTLEDRRQRNPVSALVLMTSSKSMERIRLTWADRFPLLEIPARDSAARVGLASFITDLRSAFLLDVRVVIDSATVGIPGVYLKTGRLEVFEPNSIRLGDFLPHEERQLLVEMKAPKSYRGRHFLTVRCRYRHPIGQEVICDEERSLLIPSVQSQASVERLRNDFITTRALAESRRLEGGGDFIRARQMLLSADVLLELLESKSAKEGLCGVRAELAALQHRQKNYIGNEEEQLLTPMTAWRVAERLARVAMMRKSANRVRDLYGLENARF